MMNRLMLATAWMIIVVGIITIVSFIVLAFTSELPAYLWVRAAIIVPITMGWAIWNIRKQRNDALQSKSRGLKG